MRNSSHTQLELLRSPSVMHLTLKRSLQAHRFYKKLGYVLELAGEPVEEAIKEHVRKYFRPSWWPKRLIKIQLKTEIAYDRFNRSYGSYMWEATGTYVKFIIAPDKTTRWEVWHNGCVNEQGLELQAKLEKFLVS